MKETFFDIADKRVVQAAFIAPGLPSSKSFNFFVQVPPNGPLNITCQKTRSPKKILTIYTKLKSKICVFINQASDPNSMDIIHAL